MCTELLPIPNDKATSGPRQDRNCRCVALMKVTLLNPDTILAKICVNAYHHIEIL